MPSDVSPDLRRLVVERARHQCEYCLLPEAASLHRHEPDHIIPRQHGGETVADNLALACFRCNKNKGPNVGSFDPLTGQLTPFFHPRVMLWGEHFVLEEGVIQPLSAEARVTVKIFRFNDETRVLERQRLVTLGLYGRPGA